MNSLLTKCETSDLIINYKQSAPSSDKGCEKLFQTLAELGNCSYESQTESVLRESLAALLEFIFKKEEEQRKLREKQEAGLERLWIMVSELRKDHEHQMESLRAELQRQPAPFDKKKNTCQSFRRRITKKLRTDNKSSEKAVDNQAEKVTQHRIIRNNRKPQDWSAIPLDDKDQTKEMTIRSEIQNRAEMERMAREDGDEKKANKEMQLKRKEEKKLFNLFENREKQHLKHQEKRRKDDKKKEKKFLEERFKEEAARLQHTLKEEKMRLEAKIWEEGQIKLKQERQESQIFKRKMFTVKKPCFVWKLFGKNKE